MTQIRRILNLANYGFPTRRPLVPLLVIFHITTRCNMACLHCADDVWGNPEEDLSFEEIETFSQDLGNVEQIALGGGEPFLRSDLPDICRLFVKNNGVTVISIPSNGFATNTTYTAVQTILGMCPDVALNIMLSLDGFQKTHDAIRTKGSFKSVMETARCLQDLQKEFSRLSITFNATINNLNCYELPSLADFIRNEFKASLEFNVISGNPRDAGCALPGRKELERTVEHLLTDSSSSLPRRLYNKLYRRILLQANFEHRQPIPCRAGSLVCLVDANGDVHTCPMLPPVGNLRTASFRNIWHGHLARQQFQSITGGECHCNNDCFIRLSLSHYWKLPFLMLGTLFSFDTNKPK